MIHTIKKNTPRISFYALCFLACFIVQSVKASDVFSFNKLEKQFIASDMKPIKPVAQLESEMANGNLESQVSLGIILGFGYGVAAQPERAYKLIKQASDAGNANAHYIMAIFKQHGVGTCKDTHAAQQYLEKAVQQKSVMLLFVIAQNNNLSKTYQLSNQDRFIHIKNAADQGSFFAKYYLGCVYHFGSFGTSVNTSLAKSYYQQAAEMGLNEAGYRLAFLLLEDKQPAKQAQGRKLIHQLADLNHKHAKLLLTFAQFTGKFGFEKKPDIALKKLTQLAQQGDVIAIKRLYSIYKYAWYGIEKNEQKAYAILDDAINNQNIVDAELYFLMSFKYSDYEIPTQQYLHYLILAAEQGHARANYTLGIIYQDQTMPSSFQTDAAKGFAYLKSAYALDPNDMDAVYAFARNHELGIGTTENVAKAIELYEHAAKHDHEHAIFRLMYLFNEKGAPSYNPKKYHQYIKQAENIMPVYEFTDAMIFSSFGAYSVYSTRLSTDVCQGHRAAADRGSIFSYQYAGICQQKGIGADVSGKKALQRFKAMTTLTQEQLNHPDFIRFSKKYAETPKTLGYPLGNQVRAEGYYAMARVYAEGTPDVPKDMRKAAQLYQTAVDANHLEATYALADLYRDGKGVGKNMATYISLLEKAAALGDTDALIKLGWAHSDDELGLLDYPKALYYWQKVLSSGDDWEKRIAYRELADQYKDGKAVEIDHKRAYGYYQAAAELGDEAAEVELANMHLYGMGVTQDIPKALSLLRKATKEKNVHAYIRLAEIYEHNMHDEGKDIRQAERLYKEALALDLTDYETTWINKQLNYLYEDYPDLKPAYAGTLAQIKQQAAAGDNNSIIKLAALYERGLIVEKNWEQVITLLTSLVNQGNAEAIYQLSRFYHVHPKVYADKQKEAYALRTRAAELGHDDAMLFLASDYFRGTEYLEKNTEKGLFWAETLFQSSSSLKAEAATMLAGYYFSDKSIADYDKAFFYNTYVYENMQKNDLDYVYYRLGYMYKNGLGTPKNLKLARKMYELAQKAGNIKAAKRLANLK